MFQRDREWSYPDPRFRRSLVVERFTGEDFRGQSLGYEEGVWNTVDGSEQRDARIMKQFQSGAWKILGAGQKGTPFHGGRRHGPKPQHSLGGLGSSLWSNTPRPANPVPVRRPTSCTFFKLTPMPHRDTSGHGTGDHPGGPCSPPLEGEERPRRGRWMMRK
jgi:hypothetical protein